MFRASARWSVDDDTRVRRDLNRPRELLRPLADEISLLSLEPPLGPSCRSSLGRSRGGISVGVSECVSEGGVSSSGESVLLGAALGGRDGKDLSSRAVFAADFCRCAALRAVFFLRLAIIASWHSMQNIPCDVRAYRKFSIFFLQFLHLKQLAQKA